MAKQEVLWQGCVCPWAVDFVPYRGLIGWLIGFWFVSYGCSFLYLEFNLWMTMFSFDGGDTSLQLLSLIPCSNISPASHQGKPSVRNIFFVDHSQCTVSYWKWPLRLNRQEPKTVWQNQISSRKVSNVTDFAQGFFKIFFAKENVTKFSCQVLF